LFGITPVLSEHKEPLPSAWSASYNLPPTDIANFAGEIEPIEYVEGQFLYRVIGARGNPTGAYWATSEPPRSEAAWRSEYAVLSEWNAGTCEEQYIVGPVGLKAWVGVVAPQRDRNGAFLHGMGMQVFVPLSNQQFDKSRIKYRLTAWN
jgi:hypothetical protein